MTLGVQLASIGRRVGQLVEGQEQLAGQLRQLHLLLMLVIVLLAASLLLLLFRLPYATNRSFSSGLVLIFSNSKFPFLFLPYHLVLEGFSTPLIPLQASPASTLHLLPSVQSKWKTKDSPTSLGQ